MISKDKQYRTRDGREVRIYATDHSGYYSVLGAIISPNGDITSAAWPPTGQNYVSGTFHQPSDDLIEVKPRIRVDMWGNAYKGGDERWYFESPLYSTREEARDDAEEYHTTKHIVIEGEEGQDDE